MDGDVGMGCTMRKIVETRNPLSNTIKDTSTIMRNPSLHNSGKGLRMIVLVSLIVLLRGFPCFHDFSHGASHPYIAIHSMEWFYTCSTYLTLGVHVQEGYGTFLVCVCMSVQTPAPASLVSTLKMRCMGVYLRLFSVFYICGFSIKPSIWELWCEKANMQISMYV